MSQNKINGTGSQLYLATHYSVRYWLIFTNLFYQSVADTPKGQGIKKDSAEEHPEDTSPDGHDMPGVEGPGDINCMV